jgi:hypothetical protein
VTPLPFLAHVWTGTWGCRRTAGTDRSRLLAIDARRHHHMLVHVALRLGHSNGHGNCKYGYGAADLLIAHHFSISTDGVRWSGGGSF